MRVVTAESEAKLFWAKVARGPGCWEWQGGRLPRGYGRWRHRRQEAYAHRQAWVLTNGPIPAGLLVRHSCDNPPCVRPDHLLLGTYKQNVGDSIERGRWKMPPRVRGLAPASRKLSVVQARQIKQRLAAGAGPAELAMEYQVSRSAIYAIREGRNWKAA